jgi:hypothetical protein
MANEFKIKNGLITPVADSQSYKLSGAFTKLSSVTSYNLVPTSASYGYPNEPLEVSIVGWATPPYMFIGGFSGGFSTNTYNALSAIYPGTTAEIKDTSGSTVFTCVISNVVSISSPGTPWGGAQINISSYNIVNSGYASPATLVLATNTATIGTSGNISGIQNQSFADYVINDLFLKTNRSNVSGNNITIAVPAGTTIPVGAQIGTYATTLRSFSGIASDGSMSNVGFNPTNSSWAVGGLPLTGATSGNTLIALGVSKPTSYTTNEGILIGTTGTGQNLTSGYASIFIGDGVGSSNTTGSMNLGIGSYAFSNNITGQNNVSLGNGANGRFTSSNYCIAIGDRPLMGGSYGVSGGSDMIAIGRQALGTRNESYNIGIGSMALYNGTNGMYNVAVGHDAGIYFAKTGYTSTGNVLIGAETGNQNWSGGNSADSNFTTMVGYRAGYNAGGGASFCTFMGALAGYNNYAYPGNVAIGYQASYGSQGNSGTYTTTVGYQAGYTAGGGNYSVSIGYQAGYNSYVTFGSNCYIGYYSGRNSTWGVGNTYLGYYAGAYTTSASNNTIIGNLAGTSLTTGSYNIFIGDQAGTNETVTNNTTIIGNSNIYKAKLFGIIETQAAFSEKLDPLAVSSSASGTIQMDVLNTGILYYRGNSTGNWTLNLRGNSVNTFNNAITNERTLTVVLMATNGSTAYYQTGFTIDGTSVPIKWQGGTAPNAGNTNSVDMYTITVIKITSNTYTAFGAVSKFA